MSGAEGFLMVEDTDGLEDDKFLLEGSNDDVEAQVPRELSLIGGTQDGIGDVIRELEDNYEVLGDREGVMYVLDYDSNAVWKIKRDDGFLNRCLDEAAEGFEIVDVTYLETDPEICGAIEDNRDFEAVREYVEGSYSDAVGYSPTEDIFVFTPPNDPEFPTSSEGQKLVRTALGNYEPIQQAS